MGLQAHAVHSANSAIQDHLKQGNSTKNGKERKYSEERTKVGC